MLHRGHRVAAPSTARKIGLPVGVVIVVFFLVAFSTSGGRNAAIDARDGALGAGVDAKGLATAAAAGQRASASSASADREGDPTSVASDPKADEEALAELSRLREQVTELESSLEELRAVSRDAAEAAAATLPPNDDHDDGDDKGDHDHDALMPHHHDGPPRVLIMILTVCGGKGPERRRQVRESWLRMMGGSDGAVVSGYEAASPALQFDALFFIGKCPDAASLAKMDAERDEHGDIVYETGFEEKYSNLANKVLHMMRWAARNRVFDLLIKCDDDTFINVPGVVDAVQRDAKGELRALYMGKLAKGLKPAFEDERAAWEGHLHHKQFAPFMFGCSYALSRDLVHFLAQKEVKFHAVYGEDTAMGLWLSALTVRRVDLGDRINNMGGPEVYANPCKDKFDYFAYHYMDGAKAKERAENFLKTGKACLSSQLS